MKRFLLGFSLMIVVSFAFSQGSTTSGINGKVIDKNGEPIVGASVIALSDETGAKYGNVTDVSGTFRIPNMKVGTSYNVTISFVGFAEVKQENVVLSLGKPTSLNVTLQESAAELDEIVVTAGGLIDANRTGAETNVTARAINSLPNASRSIQDFTRLTPQASVTSGGGISIAGQNNRYNSIFIDGATSNDAFGLAGNGQNGGQVNGLSLISMDALEQISVQVSPYDVTLGGFTGGGISAVTRSGTNDIQGSAYYFVRNDKLSGKTPKFIAYPAGIEREKLDEYSAKTVGVRIGGPILKNKLFFFVNAEMQNDETPNPFSFASYSGSITQQEVDNLLSTLNTLGYDPGSYENTIAKLEAQKFLAKIDWNINETHKLSVRHSYNKGENYSPSTSSTTRIRFANSGIYFPSETNSSALELSSNFSNKSNKLILGYTTVVDNRDPIGSPFPYVDITGSQDIEFGSEQYSTANLLEQKIFTLTDNFTFYKGDHTITVGTHNEFYDMNNVFIRQNFGSYDFGSIQDFIDNVNGVTTGNSTDYDRSYSLVDETTGDVTAAAAAFKASQIGFYIQDEFQVNNKLKLTGGLRFDIPMYSSDPVDDGYFNTTAAPLIEAAGHDLKGAKAGQAPSPQLMFSPRIGFNYDVNGDQSTQIRGGIGVFTSRIPFVWPGAMYNNNGATVGGVSQSGVDFNADPFDQPTLGDLGGTDAIPQGQMDLFVDDFKFPQVFRASLAVDKQLPGGFVGTVEGIYTKNINAIFYENVNLELATEQFEGTPDNRSRFTNGSIDGSYTAVYLGSNTNKGYSYNLSATVSKPFSNGLDASLSYSYGDSYAIFEGTSSQNSSQWRGVYSVDGRNNAPLGRSDFAFGSRILGSLSYQKEYLDNFATTISLFYNGQSGSPFSYTYNSGLTGEDSRERALIFVPASADEINFADPATADAQWNALEDYINEDDYLRDRKGKYAEKNMARLPFSSILDLRILQDFYLEMGNGKRNTLQLSFDIFNVGNLINGEWGRRYFTPNGDGTSVQLLDFEGFMENSNVPTYSFDIERDTKDDIIGKDDSGLISSRWQMQFGIRYIFN